MQVLFVLLCLYIIEIFSGLISLFTDLLELDFKKELELEKKRQQIERELKQLGAYEERENITIEKKVSHKY